MQRGLRPKTGHARNLFRPIVCVPPGISGPDWLRMAHSRDAGRMLFDGVYRRALIIDNNITFVPDHINRQALRSTEVMFNATRVIIPNNHYINISCMIIRKPRLHIKAIKNLNYQRHYIKITRY